MSNIMKAFENGKAFIAFITCGDPDLETTAKVVRAAVENGADLIELGIPFSDPTAEGPVIQGANLRALTGGVTTDKIFAFVRELRHDVKVPMVFMTYANVVFSYGAEKFISTCRDIQIDGLILPDLPFEEKEEFAPICHKYGVDLISLIAPTLHRFQPRCDRHTERDQDRPCLYCQGGQRKRRRTVCDRVWHFHPGAGKENGGYLRRCYRRFSDY